MQIPNAIVTPRPSKAIDTNRHFYLKQGYNVKPKKARLTPYQFTEVKCTADNYWTSSVMARYACLNKELARREASTYAAAYDKFHKLALPKASMALTLMDHQKSIAMIAQRAGQLLSFAKSVARMDPIRAYQALGLPHGKLTKTKAKAPADLWLEYTFGWVPLVEDIGAAVGVLQGSPKYERVRGAKSATWTVDAPWDGGSSATTFAELTTVCSGGIRITNPNLLLANQLGFVNPAAVAWDAVPFSFVVDWFIPVGKFLNSFTTDLGFGIEEPMVTTICVWSGANRHVAFNNGKTENYYNGKTVSRTIRPFHRPSLLDRRGLPQVSPWLAATTTSLLIQQLVTMR